MIPTFLFIDDDDAAAVCCWSRFHDVVRCEIDCGFADGRILSLFHSTSSRSVSCRCSAFADDGEIGGAGMGEMAFAFDDPF